MYRVHRSFAAAAVLVMATSVLAACSGGSQRHAVGTTVPAQTTTSGAGNALPAAEQNIHKIKHVVVIMQENRSFDSYFGTYPGRRRHPDDERQPTVCVPDPRDAAAASAPYRRPRRRQRRRPARRRRRDGRHRRRQDGRLRRQARTRPEGLRRPERPGVHATRADARRDGLPHRTRHPELLGVRARTSCCRTTCSSRTRRGACPRTCSWCRSGRPRCTRARRPGELHERARRRRTCHPDGEPLHAARSDAPIYAWTDLTYLLHKQHVSWGYYVVAGTEPDCENDDARDVRAGASRTRRRRASGTRCRTSTRSQTTASWATSSRSSSFYAAAEERHAARGVVGRAVGRRERAPAGAGQRRPGLRDEPRSTR